MRFDLTFVLPSGAEGGGYIFSFVMLMRRVFQLVKKTDAVSKNAARPPLTTPNSFVVGYTADGLTCLCS